MLHVLQANPVPQFAPLLKVAVRGVRRIREVELDLGRLTVLIARNGQGKTSTLNAIRAAVARYPGIYAAKKNNARDVLYDPDVAGDAGAEPAPRSSVLVERVSPPGSVLVSWPEQEIIEKGAAPRSSIWAAGVANPFGKDSWLAFLTGLLPGAELSSAQISAALREAGVGEVEALDVAGSIVTRHYDFDRAAQDFAEKSRAAQRAWKTLTRRDYGEKIAASWRPSGWSKELETANLAALGKELAKAKTVLIRLAQSQVATEAAQLTKLRDAAYAKLREVRAAAEQAHMQPLRAALATARSELAALGSPATEPVACPACGAPLLVKAGELTLAAVANVQQAAPPAIAAAEAQVKAASQALTAAIGAPRRSTAAEQQAEDECLALDRRIAGLGAIEEGPEVTAAKAHIVELEQAVTLVQEARNAAQHHAAVVAYRAAQAVLEPTGIRRRSLVDEIERVLNPWLRKHAAIVFDGRAIVQIDTADELLRLTVAGQRYEAVSWGRDMNSVAVRLHHIVQLMAAAHDESDLVVLDWVDTYTNPLILLLKRMIDGLDLPAVLLGMTRSDPVAMAPSIAQVLGPTYVIEAGEVLTKADS